MNSKNYGKVDNLITILIEVSDVILFEQWLILALFFTRRECGLQLFSRGRLAIALSISTTFTEIKVCREASFLLLLKSRWMPSLRVPQKSKRHLVQTCCISGSNLHKHLCIPWGVSVNSMRWNYDYRVNTIASRSPTKNLRSNVQIIM